MPRLLVTAVHELVLRVKAHRCQKLVLTRPMHSSERQDPQRESHQEIIAQIYNKHVGSLNISNLRLFLFQSHAFFGMQ